MPQLTSYNGLPGIVDRLYNGLSRMGDRLFPKAQMYEHGGFTKVVRTKPLIDPFDFSGFEQERIILRKLEDVKGVPKFFMGGESMYGYQHPAGKPLAKAELSSTYFKDLRMLVTAIHSKDVAGLDYSRNSVLMDADGNPVVPNFSGAIIYENGGAVFYPKMWPIVMQHFEGIFDRRARTSITLRQDLKLSKRIMAYSKRVIKNRRQKKFEQAKKLDRGFVLLLETIHQPRSLTAEEDSDLNYFLSEKLII